MSRRWRRDTLSAPPHLGSARGVRRPDVAADLAPTADIRRLAIGNDHTGVALKKIAIVPASADARAGRRPTWARTPRPPWTIPTWRPVSPSVAHGGGRCGYRIDGAGIGSAIAANKVNGIRAAMCNDVTIARYSREHNGANVMNWDRPCWLDTDRLAHVDVWMGMPMREAELHSSAAKIKRLEESFVTFKQCWILAIFSGSSRSSPKR